MPFNSGGQTYQGGQYLYSGLSGLGKGIGDAIAGAQEQSKMESYNDSIVQHAYQAGQVDLEGLTKYRQMSHTAKTGFAASLAANFAEDMKREQLRSLQEQRQAQNEVRQQQAAAFNWTPDEAARQAARWTGNELVQTGPGKFQAVAYGDTSATGGAGDPNVKRLKVDGKELPYISVTYPGSKQSQVLPDFGSLPTKIDPVTKSPYFETKQGKQFLTGQALMAGQMMPPEPTPTPPPEAVAPADQPLPGNVFTRAYDAVFGQGGAATTPAPQQTPVPTVAPAAVATGNDVTDKRQQAIAILTQAGKPVTEANIGAVIKKLGK